MKTEKPFWYRNVNPITMYPVEPFYLHSRELEKIREYNLKNSIILSDEL